MALDWKKTSQWWYCRFTVNGKTKLINLGVKIKGQRPKSINGWGDETFRISRERANTDPLQPPAAVQSSTSRLVDRPVLTHGSTDQAN